MSKKIQDLSFIALISEDDKKLSVGRICFWICFVISLYYWSFLMIDVPSTLMQTLTTLLMYNLFKKGIGGYFATKNNIQQNTSIDYIDEPAPKL